MKNSLIGIADKILLRKRILIETVKDELKTLRRLNIPDTFFEKKPAIDVNFVNDGQLSIF